MGTRLIAGRDVRMFLRQGFALAGIGLVVGIAAAIASGRWMSSLLFGVGPLDPVTSNVAAVSSRSPIASSCSIEAALIRPIWTSSAGRSVA